MTWVSSLSGSIQSRSLLLQVLSIDQDRFTVYEYSSTQGVPNREQVSITSMASPACASPQPTGTGNRGSRTESSLWLHHRPRHICRVVSPVRESHQLGMLVRLSCRVTHQDCVSIWVLLHGFLQTFRQILFERRVFYDWHAQGVMETQHASLASALWNPFDLFYIADLEASVWAIRLLHQESHQHTPLRMRMNAATSTSLESCQKQRRTG